ncbi:MAG: methyltransferase domain-containing protein [Ignavibacteria bacterium]|nr:methyltransferase domain-containing protein [Ignavibacteria bacterium]
MDVGSGTTTLIEKLLQDCYNNTVATDISDEVLAKAQDNLKKRSLKKIE